MPLSLAGTEYGSGAPVAILHGLFGSGRNWASIAQRLAPRHRVIALDLRNHGASPWVDAMDYAAMAEDVRVSLNARGYERFTLLGHSMGGKVAMMLALQHAEAVERLAVADIAPVPYPMRHLREVQAMRRLDLAGLTRRSQADAALATAIPDAAERGFLLQSLIFENGGVRWRLNLKAIEREMPRLVDFPAVPEGRTYDGPALFVAGGRSEYVRAEHAPAIRRLFPKAEIAHIENAGHWLHAEQPAAFLAIVEPFLDP
jgi:pimeloyl-ACP methyl ester carboxylesterase